MSIRDEIRSVLSDPVFFPAEFKGFLANHSRLQTPAIGQIIGVSQNLLNTVQTLTYSATIATDVQTGKYFVIVATDTSAFTISNPTNAVAGRELTYDIKNSSGGVMGAITWGGDFKLAGAFTNPADTKRRTISFYHDGTNWIETSRVAADI